MQSRVGGACVNRASGSKRTFVQVVAFCSLGWQLRGTMPPLRVLQNHQGRIHLAARMVNTQAVCDGDLRIQKRLLQSAPTKLSTGLENPGRVRTEGGLDEQSGRHQTVIGPVLTRGVRHGPSVIRAADGTGNPIFAYATNTTSERYSVLNGIWRCRG